MSADNRPPTQKRKLLVFGKKSDTVKATTSKTTDDTPYEWINEPGLPILCPPETRCEPRDAALLELPLDLQSMLPRFIRDESAKDGYEWFVADARRHYVQPEESGGRSVLTCVYAITIERTDPITPPSSAASTGLPNPSPKLWEAKVVAPAKAMATEQRRETKEVPVDESPRPTSSSSRWVPKASVGTRRNEPTKRASKFFVSDSEEDSRLF
ncbi:hypothetical protein FQN54_001399 [Arachnomyces sp. PD_36]|nr:hypothetical protein FQN54_001399 [Arachnomyces sp. PD_36]